MTTMNNPDQLIAKREELFIRLYKKAFPTVAAYISRRGGSFDEAKDVFQDALVIYYEKTINTDTNEIAYLIGIAKHLWLKRYRDNDQNIPLENIDVSADMDDESPSTKRIMHFLEKAGSKCMELLKGFYYDQLPLTDIASAFGFSGVRSATVQKYKCLEKVRETIKQKALQYEDFME
ncbi:DNA-directed RNA polymerase specialized sigma subunit, sigma24 family [Mucilaginibacter mallensis]|uniref:DNA-directed RNA polymerase specialized sigma subunit, sigma24 family n=1 Tax=Mucilaginibacter mallensis TaxID=652787 RepID=A0A1H1RSN5_MUCMA|nr:sigma-70 family RNA polymerase sigma factor [Mucilaginibacter mallensis]SDS38682.1 DNA-directed RNA polymerase specialized sigma subunit, sigma24 family [Mucilaginibacter mallensis]